MYARMEDYEELAPWWCAGSHLGSIHKTWNMTVSNLNFEWGKPKRTLQVHMAESISDAIVSCF
jgi:hypothetical protein